MSARIKIIEFAGISGSGKSTLVSLSAEHLNSKGHVVTSEYIVKNNKISRFFEKCYTGLFQLIADPLRSMAIIRECFRCHYGSPAAIRDVINFFFLLYRYRSVSRGKQDSIVLLDQGLVQACWSLMVFGGKETDMVTWFKNELDHVVFVDTEPEIAWIRLVTRDYKGSRPQRQMDKDQFVSRVNHPLELLKKQLANLSSEIQLIDVENSSDSLSAAKRLNDTIIQSK